MDANPLSDSPYVGLQPFSAKEQKYFFGRERDGRIISSNLFAAPLTVLYGSSGVGKSSILQAGVVPVLRQSPRTAVVSFQRWPEKDPIQILKTECLDALRAAGCEGVQVDMRLPFDEFLFQAAQAFHGTILILLDQFEEYFLYHRETGNTFDAEFARAVNREDIDANFLIALREDSLSMLDRFRTRIPNLLGNSLRLRHLDEKSAREAICKPLDVYNQEHADKPPVTIEEELVQALIHDIQAGKLALGQAGRGGVEDRNDTSDSNLRIEAPFLQLVLIRLWEEEIQLGSNALRLETLNRLGGAKRIVQTHLDHVMNTLPSGDQDIAASIFQYLVTPSGTKIAYTVKDLAFYANSVTPQILESVLDKLAKGNVRILRQVTLPGEPSRYEIFHDVLGPAILDWRTRFQLIRAKGMRSLIVWASIGTLVDALIFLPVGQWFFGRGLKNVIPAFTRGQRRWMGFGWFLAHIFGLIILLFSMLSFYGGDPFRLYLISLLTLTFFLSGPIGAFVVYRLIKWSERRRANKAISVVPVPAT